MNSIPETFVYSSLHFFRFSLFTASFPDPWVGRRSWFYIVLPGDFCPPSCCQFKVAPMKEVFSFQAHAARLQRAASPGKSPSAADSPRAPCSALGHTPHLASLFFFFRVLSSKLEVVVRTPFTFPDSFYLCLGALSVVPRLSHLLLFKLHEWQITGCSCACGSRSRWSIGKPTFSCCSWRGLRPGCLRLAGIPGAHPRGVSSLANWTPFLLLFLRQCERSLPPVGTWLLFRFSHLIQFFIAWFFF